MLIYIDTEYKCHISNLDCTYRAFELDFFDGKCQTFIEGYRYCPKGESYVRNDGEVFYGECIVPWKSNEELNAIQHEYEKQKLNEYNLILQELGVET